MSLPQVGFIWLSCQVVAHIIIFISYLLVPSYQFLFFSRVVWTNLPVLSSSSSQAPQGYPTLDGCPSSTNGILSGSLLTGWRGSASTARSSASGQSPKQQYLLFSTSLGIQEFFSQDHSPILPENAFHPPFSPFTNSLLSIFKDAR